MTSRFLKKILCLLLFCGMCTMKQQVVAASKAEPVDYVNPYMGNISHLLVPTYPIVHLPNSLPPKRRLHIRKVTWFACVANQPSGKLCF